MSSQMHLSTQMHFHQKTDYWARNLSDFADDFTKTDFRLKKKNICKSQTDICQYLADDHTNR